MNLGNKDESKLNNKIKSNCVPLGTIFSQTQPFIRRSWTEFAVKI